MQNKKFMYLHENRVHGNFKISYMLKPITNKDTIYMYYFFRSPWS